jgi:hypothetical protein
VALPLPCVGGSGGVGLVYQLSEPYRAYKARQQVFVFDQVPVTVLQDYLWPKEQFLARAR